jgi:hypothetical protein
MTYEYLVLNWLFPFTCGWVVTDIILTIYGRFK